MTSRKNLNSKGIILVPMLSSDEVCDFLEELENAPDPIEKVDKKILAVALRPTRKRRVNAEQFEFKN